MRASKNSNMQVNLSYAGMTFAGKGDVYYCIAIAALNGIPFGAKWLADDILADVIDYDEFLTGMLNHA